MKFSRSIPRRALGLVPILFSLALLISIFWLAAASARASQAETFSSNHIQRNSVLSNTHVITIGFAGILSGPNSTWGFQQLYSVQLAVSQTNAAGGVDIGGVPYQIVLAIADDQQDPVKAMAAAHQLIDAGAVAVIGHTFTMMSYNAQPIYAQAGVPMLLASSTNPILTSLGYTNTFRTITNDATPPRLLADFLRNVLGRKKSAIVVSGWSMLGDVFSSTFKLDGGSITARHYVANSLDFTTTLQAIKDENPDVIANLSYPNDAGDYGLFSKIAYNLGMTDIPIAVLEMSNDESRLAAYASAAGPLAAQGDYAQMDLVRYQDMPGWTQFLTQYLAAGHPDPGRTGITCAYSYDSANLLIDAIHRAGSTNKAAIRDKLAATQGFKGVVGIYKGFDKNGDVIPQWSFMEWYHSGSWHILNPSRVFLPSIQKIWGP
jgi:branched-chain amino acid transport system substrate-binding protein